MQGQSAPPCCCGRTEPTRMLPTCTMGLVLSRPPARPSQTCRRRPWAKGSARCVRRLSTRYFIASDSRLKIDFGMSAFVRIWRRVRDDLSIKLGNHKMMTLKFVNEVRRGPRDNDYQPYPWILQHQSSVRKFRVPVGCYSNSWIQISLGKTTILRCAQEQ